VVATVDFCVTFANIRWGKTLLSIGDEFPVFRAMLSAPDWDEPSLGAFCHFLVEHIRLDSGEHRSLRQHLVADDHILPPWSAFRDILVAAAPRLAA
jgi:hypothetical protein